MNLLRLGGASLLALSLAHCGARSKLRGEDLAFDASPPQDLPAADVPGVDTPRPDVPPPIDAPRIDVPPPRDLPLPVDRTPPPDVTSTVTVTCPAAVFGRQGESVGFAAQARSNLGLPLRFAWVVEARPMGSGNVPTPPDQLATTFAFDAGGEWRLRFTATDARGATATCTTRLVAQPAVELLCPNDQSNYQGATVSLVAVARSNFARPLTLRWSTLSRPPASTTGPTPDTSASARLLLDALGDWRMRLVATDSAGFSSTCETRVHADPDVVVSCPEDSRSVPFATINLRAAASSRLALPLTYRWEIVERPVTSTALVPSPTTLSTPYTFDVAGDWTWRFTATNSRGNSAYCTTRARAASNEAVRVEIVWNTDRSCASCNAQGGGQDIDLHLTDVSRAMGHWASQAPDNSDCYYGNCTCGMPGMLCATERLDWPPMGRTNNPQLDVDHVSDLPGPENINVVQAAEGAQYDVGVHFFSAHGESNVTPVTARIYCAGAVVFESEAVRLTENNGGSDNNLWRVGRITVTPAGCTFARCGAPGALTACIRPQSAW